MHLKKTLTALAMALGMWSVSGAWIAEAATEARTVEYRQGDTVLEGYLAQGAGPGSPKPGVLVVHDWMGLGPQTKQAADKLAELGYTALAVDIYGKGIRPKNPEEAGMQAGLYKGNRPLMRERMEAAFEFLKSRPGVDASRIAAVGYCFGGTAVLELARDGAELEGVVSFHGGLSADGPASGKPFRARVLALHGAEDPYVPKPEVEAFVHEMRAAGTDWQLVVYSGAVHAFTNPDAGTDPSKGAAYDPKAAARAWEAMRSFLKEILG